MQDGSGMIVFLLVLLYSVLSSSPFSSFPVIYVQQQAGLGRGRTGLTRAAMHRNAGRDGGGQRVRVILFFSLLYFLLLALLLFRC